MKGVHVHLGCKQLSVEQAQHLARCRVILHESQAPQVQLVVFQKLLQLVRGVWDGAVCDLRTRLTNMRLPATSMLQNFGRRLAMMSCFFCKLCSRVRCQHTTMLQRTSRAR